MTTYTINDSPKMLRETLCVAQSRIGNSPLDQGRKMEHIDRLQRLINECDRHRPLGPDGNHDDRHTPTCGCDVPTPAAEGWWADYDDGNGSEYTWRPQLQIDGCCLQLETWFKTRDECLDFIRTQVLPLGMLND